MMEIRCPKCGKRLLDLIHGIARIEIKCPRCKPDNYVIIDLELPRGPQSPSNQQKAIAPQNQNATSVTNGENLCGGMAQNKPQ